MGIRGILVGGRFLVKMLLVLAMVSFPVMAQTAPKAARVTVPFVGCEADGQMGPVRAPHGKNVAVNLPAVVAEKLAFYKADEGQGMIGPRGWHCFETYGSDGENLYLAPQVLRSEDFLGKPGEQRFMGPAVQLSTSFSDTSGRIQVARVIARVFPDRMDFVNRVSGEPHDAGMKFPRGKFLTDRLRYVDRDVVEFETPAGRDGLGTMSWFGKSEQPVRGMAMLSFDDDDPNDETTMVLTQLSLRLPVELQGLGDVMVKDAENRNAPALIPAAKKKTKAKTAN